MARQEDDEKVTVPAHGMYCNDSKQGCNQTNAPKKRPLVRRQMMDQRESKE